MEPFDRRPNGGQTLLGKLKGANARHEYGLRLQRLTGEHRCSYCALSLVDTFEHLLLLQVDHVVPVSVARRLAIPLDFYQDMVNCVLACSACNSFDNHFDHVTEQSTEWLISDFVTLRDVIFTARKARIMNLLVIERAFFDSQPWATV